MINFNLNAQDDTISEKEKIKQLESELILNKNALSVARENFSVINKKLKAEVIRADSASATKNTFLANIGHELITPLTSILGFAEILIDNYGFSSEETKQYLKIINKKSQELLRLVNDLLDISKMEAGKLSLVPEPTNIKKMIEEINKNYIDDIKNKKVKYKTDIDEKIPKYLLVDSFRLKQILANLISNSIKFTDEGYIELRVKKLSNDIKEGYVELEFEVTDTGIGIPKQKQHLLFKPFSQVQDNLIKHYGGTGLGLAIAKRLVEMMKGKIWLEDNVPNGTKFCFTIIAKIKKIHPPIINENDNEKNKEEFIKKQTEKINNILNILKINILVVENDESSSQMLKILLYMKNNNINFIPAVNGQQAVEIYKNNKIDIIITDIHMEIMDGISMINQIRSIEAKTNKHIPIVAMTAYATPGDKDRCLSAGADYYIQKPIFKSDLYDIIDKVVKRFFSKQKPI